MFLEIFKSKKTVGLVLVLCIVLFLFVPPVTAASAPSWGAASSFAVLAGSTVTNTGPSIITGDVDVSPGTAITGFPPGVIVSGGMHSADTQAANAQIDAATAYNFLVGQTSTATVSADLGGQTLTSGVYTSATSLGLTGILTLDGGGDSNSVFIFQAGSTLTTAAGSQIILVNGAQASNVFWQVGSSAIIGANSIFVGNILAYASITLTTGASVNGRVLALNGAVTLDTNTIGFTLPFVTPENPFGVLTIVGVGFAALGFVKIKFNKGLIKNRK